MGVSKKILVVDDEPDLVDFVRLRLTASGFEVVTAADGEEALDVVQREHPDLIILDILLPKLDGHKVCETLKKDPRFAAIPIIMLTAKDREEDILLAKKIGADAYITKPFDSQLLLYDIKKLIR
ncbi:MAG TPA: response regulator [Candidatus Omnitrophota bacterium]|nr:response regulator [Candidatus Omnitrophota bacterium]HPT07909.1 response regulator [Candidatus Omnitrophota bacterium]